VTDLGGLSERMKFLLTNWKYPFAYVLGAFIVALPQLIYWKAYAGHWLFFSYHGDDKTFSFLHPHTLNVLFSYQKGWFVYTPVMILSVLGFYPLFKNYRSIFWSILIFFIVNLYLVSSWDIWWYGGSFSMRALIQSYALLLFPMAAFLDSMLRRSLWKYVMFGILLFCGWLNLMMTYQCNGNFKYGTIEGEGMTRAYFWRIFGRTDISLKDKKLLDTNEELPDRLESGLKEIYHNDMEEIEVTDTTFAHSGKKSIKLDKENQTSEVLKIPVNPRIQKGWYRIYVQTFFPEKEWNVWSQTQFYVSFYSGDKIVKRKMIRIQRITEQGVWNEIYLDIKVPHKDYDSLGVSFWNSNGQKAIYIDDIRAVYTPDE
jgi:hypothetical protein